MAANGQGRRVGRMEVAERSARGGSRAAAQMESRQQVTAAFSAALTGEQIAEEVVRHSRKQLKAAAAWLVVLDEQRRNLRTLHTDGCDPEVVTRDEVAPTDATLPLAEVARTGRALWYPKPQRLWARMPVFAAAKTEVGSAAIIPLGGAGECMGALGLCFPKRRGFSASERDDLLTLGRMAGEALRRAERYDIERGIAAALQRWLLPAFPELPSEQCCVRYRPAEKGPQIGGDWYDAMDLSGGTLGVVVGDVVGHGIDAAAVMGQMRSAMRACVLSDHDPGHVLTRLNMMAHRFPGMTMTTLFYGLYHPPGKLHYVSAGHPPPLIKNHHGTVRTLFDEPPSPPINVQPEHRYTTATAPLKPGETLIAYTDGLIERRGEPIDDSITNLADALTTGPHDLNALCDHLLTHRPPGDHHDDTALLALRPPSR